MSFSPAKRRKINNTDALHTNNADDQQRPRGETNSLRPGSQAQLHAAGRLPTRSPTRTQNQDEQSEQREQRDRNEERALGLRDRKALRPSLTSTASPTTSGARNSGGGSSLLSPPKKPSGIQAFFAPPRRVSRKSFPTDLAFGSPSRPQDKPSQRVRKGNTQDNQLEPGLSGAAGNDEDRDLDQPLQGEFNEPELPPTPTQLALEQPSDGQSSFMSSSSSRGRVRRRATDLFRPSLLALEDDGADHHVGEAQDLSVKEFEEPAPEAVLRKRRSKTKLSAELQQLKNEINELEHWTQKLNQTDDPKGPADIEALTKLILSSTSEEPSDTAATARSVVPSFSSLVSSLLPFSSKAPRKNTLPTSNLPTNPFALRETAQAKPYLTIFAPLALTAQSNKVSASKPGSLTETHELTLTAPSPFPRNLYSVTVVYETNPELQSLLSISVPTDTGHQNSSIPEVLRHWMNSRLENPLLKLDISGLCWGINRYWEAATYRAQIWTEIEKKYSKLTTNRSRARSDGNGDPIASGQDKSDDELNSETFTASNIRFLLPHLERSSMLFTSTSDEKQKQKSHKPKILFSCPITLDDWTGEPQLRPGISVSTPLSVDGVSSKRIEQELKKLFHALLNEGSNTSKAHADGGKTIVRAIGGVLDGLFGSEIGVSISKGKKALAKG